MGAAGAPFALVRFRVGDDHFGRTGGTEIRPGVARERRLELERDVAFGGLGDSLDREAACVSAIGGNDFDDPFNQIKGKPFCPVNDRPLLRLLHLVVWENILLLFNKFKDMIADITGQRFPFQVNRLFSCN